MKSRNASQSLYIPGTRLAVVHLGHDAIYICDVVFMGVYYAYIKYVRRGQSSPGSLAGFDPVNIYFASFASFLYCLSSFKLEIAPFCTIFSKFSRGRPPELPPTRGDTPPVPSPLGTSGLEEPPPPQVDFWIRHCLIDHFKNRSIPLRVELHLCIYCKKKSWRILWHSNGDRLWNET